jgi:uncharacterized RDD family membrane protein YckC
MSDSHQVVTPENIELDYEIAGIGSRFLALAIDMLIQGLLTVGIGYGLSLIDLDKLRLDEKIPDLSHSLSGAGFLCLLALIWLGYYIILEATWNGQTIGKRALNIRVRKELGYAPNLWDIMLRNIIRLVDFLPFGYSIGFITMFCNKNAKRLGDYAAGTIVVKELPRQKLNRYLNTQSPDAKLSSGLQPTIENETYPWLESLLPKLSQPDYLIMNNLHSRRAQLTNYPQLALETIKKMLTKAPEISIPALESSEAPLILAKLIRRYEKAYFD